MDELLQLELNDLIGNLLRLTAAFLITLPLAWNREKATQAVGLRTFPLVAVGACGFVLLGRQVLGGDPNAEARIIQGLMTGVGFIGGGAILKHGGSVHGTATAASMWATGIIGAATAYGRYEIAISISLLNLALLLLLTPLKNQMYEDQAPGSDRLRDRDEAEQ